MTDTQSLSEQALTSDCGEEPIDACVATNLRMLTRAITSIYDEALRPFGLRITQMALLLTIRCGRAATATELARRLIIDRSTLSRTLDRMIAQGWIEAEESTDARVQLLRVTEAGCRLVESATPAWTDAQRRAGDLLDSNGVDQIRQVRERVEHRQAEG